MPGLTAWEKRAGLGAGVVAKWQATRQTNMQRCKQIAPTDSVPAATDKVKIGSRFTSSFRQTPC